MNRPVIVIGAGGHAKVLIDAIKLSAIRIIGVTDLLDTKLEGVKYLGTDQGIFNYKPDQILLVNGVGSVGVSAKRKNLFDQFKEKGYSFANVIHPSAVIGSRVELGEGVQIMAGAIIQTGAVIGRNTIINTRASVDHDAQIGDHVHIAPGAVLCGGVSVEEGAFIGAGATITQGTKIQKETLVKAGSLVTAKSEIGIYERTNH